MIYSCPAKNVMPEPILIASKAAKNQLNSLARAIKQQDQQSELIKDPEHPFTTTSISISSAHG
jgi:hypothetical protein